MAWRQLQAHDVMRVTVGEKVEEDLLHARGVDHEGGGQRRIDEPAERQVFAGGHVVAEQRRCLHDVAHIVACRVQRQLTGLDLAVVEDVVDDGEQQVSAGERGNSTHKVSGA